MSETGFDPDFLGFGTSVPAANDVIADDLLSVDGATTIRYMHFSLAMSTSRRFARWVAWNVNGATLADEGTIRRVTFRPDPRVPIEHQVVNDAYEDNRLDRGHIARRADLLWGNAEEAKRGNADSFFYTNITPQIETFNQSKKNGVWGLLENAVLEQTREGTHRISVFGGPVLRDDDEEYRGIQIPRAFWKVLAYDVGEGPKARGFVLTQTLDRIEARDLDLGPFETYAQTISEISGRSFLMFPDLYPIDATPSRVAMIDEATRQPISDVEDIEW